MEETGVDCLAVAVGTSHGVYKGEPHLEFELLDHLSKEVPVPLVLHGGSGTGDENLAKAVRTGIQKVNLNTDVSEAGKQALREALASTEVHGSEKMNLHRKDEFAADNCSRCGRISSRVRTLYEIIRV